MRYIFYQTKTKYTNTGDALINHALINILRQYGSLRANCSSEIPEEFLSRLGIRAEEKVISNSEFAFVKSVVSCAIKARKQGDQVYVFSGPGDMYGGGLRLVVRNFASGLLFPVFRLFGVKIVRIGRSVGPISKLMALSERLRCTFLSHYYVRDTLSLERCRDMGIKKVEFSPDLSWIYDADHPKRVNHTNTVMVNLRNSIFDDVHEEFIEATLRRCEELLEQLNSALSGRMKVCVAYQIAEDQEFSRIVFDRLKTVYETEYIDHQMRLDELETCYGCVDFHISNRMHSLLAGYKYGSMPLALIDTQKHVKIAATFADCDLREFMFDIYEPVDSRQVSELVCHREDLLQKLFQCEQDQQARIVSTLEYVFSQESTEK